MAPTENENIFQVEVSYKYVKGLKWDTLVWLQYVKTQFGINTQLNQEGQKWPKQY